jgi:hypothetical protein
VTANLQKLSVRQAARLMNVSERQVYKAGELFRIGREDLVTEVEAGRLALHAALKLAKPEKYRQEPDPYLSLMKAFLSAPKDARYRFISLLMEGCGQ